MLIQMANLLKYVFGEQCADRLRDLPFHVTRQRTRGPKWQRCHRPRESP